MSTGNHAAPPMAALPVPVRPNGAQACSHGWSAGRRQATKRNPWIRARSHDPAPAGQRNRTATRWLAAPRRAPNCMNSGTDAPPLPRISLTQAASSTYNQNTPSKKPKEVTESRKKSSKVAKSHTKVDESRRNFRPHLRHALALAALFLPASPAAAQSLDDLTRISPGATSARISSASPDAWSNADNRWVKPGDTHTLADITGPGVIRHIWLTFAESGPSWLSKDGAADPSEIVLRMYWDAAAPDPAPAVESPLGDFFAAGFGRRAEIVSLPVIVQGGDSYNCFWAMPFHKSAKITITNESTRPLAALYYQIDYTKEPALTPDSAYFCAQYRQEFPTQLGHDYLIADIEAPEGDRGGGGHYAGTVMSVRSRSPQWFGEGDEKFSIDGDPLDTPSMWGTGTEDYFLNAWGMQKGSYPYFGVTQLDGWLADIGQRGTMYRWHIADPVRFTRSLRITIEHNGWMSADETTTGKIEGHVEREDDFATVAFWYQRGQPKRFTTLPTAAERRFPEIDTIIEGKTLLETARADRGSLHLQKGTPWTGEGQLFFDGQQTDAWLEFTFEVPAPQSPDAPDGRRAVVPITHSYDFGIYRLLLDGEPIGPPIDFYSPDVQLQEQPLGDKDLTPGKHTIRLECQGRNPLSTGHRLGIDSIRFHNRWNKKRPPLAPPPK